MGSSFEWNATDYLALHSASVELQTILNRLAGLYFMLSGAYIRLGCDNGKYMDFARPFLREYLACLRRLDAFLEDAQAKGFLTRTGSQSAEVLGARIRVLESLSL